jgi:SAM-dependent methyltransferase
VSGTPFQRWACAYTALREREGRGGSEADRLALPWITTGPLAPQWRIRARTFERFLSAVLAPMERAEGRPLAILDLGAGDGWLSARMAERGHRAVALDARVDAVDGLAASRVFTRRRAAAFGRVEARFEELPLATGSFDLALFNASLHYTTDLSRVLAGARRVVRPGGAVAILDSPFYGTEEAGEAMLRERERTTRIAFPDLADGLLALGSIEYLTPGRLDTAALPLGLRFRRVRVVYPLAYELRGLRALLARARPPSRFDLRVAAV